MPKIQTAGKAVLVVAFASAAPATSAVGQEPTARVALSAGIATDQRGVSSNAVTVAPSLWFAPNNHISVQLGASATRFATETWSLGAGASLDGRDPIGRFGALTLNASANASRLNGSTSASFFQAELVPALELRIRPVTVFGGVRAATGFASEGMREPSLPLGARPSTTNVGRSGAGPIVGALVTIPIDAGSLQIGAREDRLRTAGEEVRDRSVSAALTHGRVTIAGSAGTRGSSDERVSFGSMALSLAIGAGASLDLAAGRYPSNRLVGTPGGSFMNAGLSLRVGRAGTPLPTAANVPMPARGWTRLAIRALDADRVDVAGDFNEWTLVAARRAKNGVWYADLKIPPGQYRYAFRVNGIEWRVPDGATAVKDDFGGKSAWLTVR